MKANVSNVSRINWLHLGRSKMLQESKLFIAAKADHDAINVHQLWKTIQKISLSNSPAPVKVLSQGKQNNPMSEKYMGYIQARFTVFTESKNQNQEVDALIVFQPNTEINGLENQLICSITTQNNDSNQYPLQDLARALVEDYDLYFTKTHGVDPIQKFSAKDPQLSHE